MQAVARKASLKALWMDGRSFPYRFRPASRSSLSPRSQWLCSDAPLQFFSSVRCVCGPAAVIPPLACTEALRLVAVRESRFAIGLITSKEILTQFVAITKSPQLTHPG
jgi:hypothetical protein